METFESCFVQKQERLERQAIQQRCSARFKIRLDDEAWHLKRHDEEDIINAMTPDLESVCLQYLIPTPPN